MLGWAIWLFSAFGWAWSLASFGGATAIWFGAFALPPILRGLTQQICIALIVFGGCTYVANRIYVEGVAVERAKWETAKNAEDQRREAQLAIVQKQQQDMIDQLTAERADLKDKLDALEVASHRNDAQPGLPADGVLRLRTIVRSGKHRPGAPAR